VFVFVPVFFTIYFILPIGLRNPFILLASLTFYTFGAGLIVWVLVFSIVFNHVVAQCIAHGNGTTRTTVFAAAIVINVSFLFYYKYAAFFTEAANTLLVSLRLEPIPQPPIELPIGISFFTFQALSYIADVFQHRVIAARRLIDFGMYHSLFPQLVAGPIVRYVEIEAQVIKRPLLLEHAAEGVYRFSLGLGKKLLIADPMGGIADMAFAMPQHELATAVAWLGLLAYTLQIYYDFSGYSDMAIGLGKLLGFDFPENFDQPYRSQNITEFWRRWHMTLSRWFRDYLYIPLGGNREGPWRTYRNLLLVFFLCGLWHGAGYTFIIWGLYHGALLVLERVLRQQWNVVPRGFSGTATTFTLVMIGWVLFRAGSLGNAIAYLKTMFLLASPEFVFYPVAYFWTPDKIAVAAAGLFFAFVPIRYFVAATDTWRYIAALPVLFWSLIVMSSTTFNPFIYFRF
jgi:alginate O-acetyltransferase complex protein AlgI